MKSKLLLTVLSLIFFTNVIKAQDNEIVTVQPKVFEQALKNPLKGFRHDMSKAGKHPYDAIVRDYVKWNELERNINDGVERILEVSNKKWGKLAQYNSKVIPRVYLDWDKESGNEYWPSDMTTFDYSSEQFRERLERLVTNLGKAWDNDSRVAWIQMGIIGYWGEHHSPKIGDIQGMEKLLGDLFSKAFKNKKVLVRYPHRDFLTYDFGFYWDRFADTKPAWTWTASYMEQFPDRWKTAIHEGEVGYGADYGDDNPGKDPDDSVSDPLHRVFLTNWIRKLHATGAGWISNYNLNNAQSAAGAAELQKVFGYRYLLKEVKYPKNIQRNQPFTVSFDVENEGSAPFYYNWPVELRLLDAQTRQVKWKQIFNNVDIRNWMPGENWNESKQEYTIPAPIVNNTATFTIDNSLPQGEYILALAILDPAGMVPSVKFATEHYFKGGNHPVGYIGIDTTIEQTSLDPSVFDDPSKDNSLNYIAENNIQSPFGGTNRKIPGLIEAEHYDEGGEWVAYYDITAKQGDPDFRAEDKVDVVAKEGASNGYAVGYTKEGEWLEYTVDVTTGMYDIALYYFCGETPGDLVVSLDGEVLDTITGLQNQGWEIRDSITAQNILIGHGGKKKILRLEFTNGAGFDIDAIKFTKQNIPVSNVTLNGCPDDTLFVGSTWQLLSAVTPSYASDLTVTWNSSDESVATVDSSGLVTALSEGTATITVATNDGGFTDTCEINSMIEVISVYGLTIGNCPSTLLQTGDKQQLTAQVAPVNAADKSVTWSSSNTQVASVDTSGVVTAISEGSVTITATTKDGGYTKTCAIGIMSSGVSVTGVEITGCPAGGFKVDSTFQLIANVTPANAGDLRVSWRSSDETVATVDENGWITPLTAGETSITATTSNGDYTDECTINADMNVNTKTLGGISQFVEVYPNPASDVLHFRFSESGSERKISVFNTLGQLLFSKNTYDSNTQIDISEFNSEGMLIVKVNSDGVAASFKVVIINTESGLH